MLDPKPKETALEGAVEYGYASLSFLEADSMACSAVSSVGFGMKERTSDFSSGRDFSNFMKRGNRLCVGRLANDGDTVRELRIADGWEVNTKKTKGIECLPSNTPTSTSSEVPPAALLSLDGAFSLSAATCAGTSRARFGAARLGRSGVGLLSIDSSRIPPCSYASSESSLRFEGRAADWLIDEASC